MCKDIYDAGFETNHLAGQVLDKIARMRNSRCGTGEIFVENVRCVCPWAWPRWAWARASRHHPRARARPAASLRARPSARARSPFSVSKPRRSAASSRSSRLFPLVLPVAVDRALRAEQVRHAEQREAVGAELVLVPAAEAVLLAARDGEHLARLAEGEPGAKAGQLEAAQAAGKRAELQSYSSSSLYAVTVPQATRPAQRCAWPQRRAWPQRCDCPCERSR
jgi:hypothetical protein